MIDETEFNVTEIARLIVVASLENPERWGRETAEVIKKAKALVIENGKNSDGSIRFLVGGFKVVR